MDEVYARNEPPFDTYFPRCNNYYDNQAGNNSFVQVSHKGRDLFLHQSSKYLKKNFSNYHLAGAMISKRFRQSYYFILSHYAMTSSVAPIPRSVIASHCGLRSS